jgi:uncharacterized repeat protein (TIGR01451 family)
MAATAITSNLGAGGGGAGCSFANVVAPTVGANGANGGNGVGGIYNLGSFNYENSTVIRSGNYGKGGAGGSGAYTISGHVGGTAGSGTNSGSEWLLNGGTVNNSFDATPPTVSSVSVPANATYMAGQNLDFAINWSENVTITGSDSTLGLIIGSTPRLATFLSKTATGTSYRYTVQIGDIDSDGITVGALTLNSTTIKDAAGNNATLTLNAVGGTTGVLVAAPTTADLSITVTDGAITATPGSPVTYTIAVSNAGPSVASGATVVDTFPAVLTGVTWTCSFSGSGSSGAASGSGNINQTINLSAGGSATYTVNATIAPSATGMLSNTAMVSPPLGTADPAPANNSATDTDTLISTATLTISIIGNGSVTSHNATGTNDTCSKTGGGVCNPVVFGNGDTVTLSATKAWNSNFASWSGAYGGSVNPGNITMDGDKAVTATFDAINKAKLSLAGTPHAGIQEAYDAAVSGDTVLAQEYYFAEPTGVTLGLLLPTAITIMGGLDPTYLAYVSPTSVTTVKGPLAIKQGRLNVQRLKIRQP